MNFLTHPAITPTGIWFFGLRFNYYGLIVGLAMLVFYSVINILAKKERNPHFSDLYFLGLVVSALVGARIWHLVTDFQLYLDDWWQAFYIWRGGLSILGAIGVGLLYSLAWWRVKNLSWSAMRHNLDMAIFALPLAQMIGRFANYLNQELPGRPTSLPWAMSLEPAVRPEGFEYYEGFHPLFAYESIVLLALFFVFLLGWKKGWLRFGSGKLSCLYFLIYGSMRFFLDFLRIEPKTGLGLGKNQLFLLFLFLSLFFIMVVKKIVGQRSFQQVFRKVVRCK
ncbi:MAG: prolipoprotein diacylglyceryl transferase [Patescibacteria group bacterium]